MDRLTPIPSTIGGVLIGFAAIDEAVDDADLSLTDILIIHGHDDHINSPTALLDLAAASGTRACRSAFGLVASAVRTIAPTPKAIATAGRIRCADHPPNDGCREDPRSGPDRRWSGVSPSSRRCTRPLCCLLPQED